MAGIFVGWITMKDDTKAFLWVQCSLVVLLAGATLLPPPYTKTRKASTGIPPSQLIRAITAASNVQRGNIAKVEVNHRSNVLVGILSSVGRKYVVRVEASTGKILPERTEKSRAKSFLWA